MDPSSDGSDPLSSKSIADNKEDCESNPTTTQLQPNGMRELLIYPPGQGGISLKTGDYSCLATDNLTSFRRPTSPDKGVKETVAQKGHARVQNWTKNRESTSVCGAGDDDSERDEAEGEVIELPSKDCDYDKCSFNAPNNSQSNASGSSTGAKNTASQQPIKQSLILIFDSLAGASRSRVVDTLRGYLSCECKVKLAEIPAPTFNKDNMPGHCVNVPQQNNFTDCGLYLLQYVEQFANDPLRDYRIPINQLANWFDTITLMTKVNHI
uniref:Ubiquitin-like protease family profile domain-containing protein n=1 Tax=Glossina austeni TaxID=7395 RepID=A0A1A9UU88_GLOAU